MQQHDDEPENESSTGHQLAVAGVFMGLGFEVGAAVIIGYYGGHWVGSRFQTGHLGAIVGTFVGLVAVTVHFFYVAKTLYESDE